MSITDAELLRGTLIPTCSFRWLIEGNAPPRLQQRMGTLGYREVWVDVPKVRAPAKPEKETEHG